MNDTPRRSELLQRFTDALDMLGVQLALARPEFFNLLSEHRQEWLREGGPIADTLVLYQKQVRHGVFLVGYAHVEALLLDVARSIFFAHPMKLPKDKQVTVGDLLGSIETRHDVLDLLVTRELRNVFGGSLESVFHYFERKLSIDVPRAERDLLIEASKIRNALLHNGGIANERLGTLGLEKGCPISLADDDVHRYAVAARSTATFIFESRSW